MKVECADHNYEATHAKAYPKQRKLEITEALNEKIRSDDLDRVSPTQTLAGLRRAGKLNSFV